MNPKARLTLLGLFLLLTFINCTKEPPENIVEEEIPEIITEEQMLLEDLVAAFEKETDISIFYETGLSSLQSKVEHHHAISEEYYYKTVNSYPILLHRVGQIIDYVNAFPKDFIQDLDLDAIILVQSNIPKWNGRANRAEGIKSIAINKLITLNDDLVLAHEIFHMFDPFASIYIPSSEFEMNWKSLNPPNFVYGSGCSSGGDIIDYSEGFFNKYAQCNPIEDRAVHFAFYYAKRNKVIGIINEDTYIDGKINFLKDLLSEYEFNFSY